MWKGDEMMNKSELTQVVGGAGWGFWTIVGGAVSFVLGFIEGLVNPVKCGK